MLHACFLRDRTETALVPKGKKRLFFLLFFLLFQSRPGSRPLFPLNGYRLRTPCIVVQCLHADVINKAEMRVLYRG